MQKDKGRTFGKFYSPINSRIADRLPLNLETGMIDASWQAERSLMDTGKFRYINL